MKSSRTEQTPATTAQRGLGLGFGEGNAFHLRSNEPNKGFINELPLPEDLMSK